MRRQPARSSSSRLELEIRARARENLSSRIPDPTLVDDGKNPSLTPADAFQAPARPERGTPGVRTVSARVRRLLRGAGAPPAGGVG